MKKVFGMIALALVFAACNKIEIDPQPAGSAEGIPFSATVSTGKSLDTRALAENGTTLQATWTAGEKVALIHNGVSDEMTVKGVSAGTATITGTITGNPCDGDPVTIIYPSSAADGTTGNVKSALLYAQDGTLTGTEGTSIVEKYDVRKGTGTLKVSRTASLSDNVSLENQFAIFKFTVRPAEGNTAIRARRLTVTIGSSTYTIAPKKASDVLYAVLPAVSAQEVSFDALDVNCKTYSCAKASVTFSAGKYYQSTLKMDLTTETMKGHDYVDMGTVVIGGVEKNLYWATCNVDAKNSWDSGEYYAWGETEPKTNYYSDWSNYFDTTDGGSTFTKYNTSGGKTVLDLEDDVANKLWGGTWRISTDEEWTALCDQTYYTWEWTDDYLGDGTNHSGMIVTRKAGTGPCSGNCIFLPAAGLVSDYVLYNLGSMGTYWSSTLKAKRPTDACCLDFYPGVVQNTFYTRYCGMPLRPVTSTPTNGSIEHEYVDMGYGMKWATTNIGANSPEESGDYFAWGETTPKSTSYFDSNYQIYRWRSGPTLGRPNKLQREHDAAHVLWGDDWRMPNYEECQTLCDQNKFTWTWDAVKLGFKVTSKQTGNSIFLPAAGAKYNSTEVTSFGTYGGIWASTSRSTGAAYASALTIFDTQKAGKMDSGRGRYAGYPIRPVRVNKVNGHEYIDLGNGLGWALENLGTDDSHPAGRADTFADGDPATAKWGAPWRTPTQAEWQWVFNSNNCYREKTADYEKAGWWFINQGSLDGTSQLPDRAILLQKNGSDGGCRYWTSSRNSDGKLLYISVTDDYIKYIGGNDTGYQGVFPVFSLSELDK